MSNKKRILLLGDSIRLQYGPVVAQLLKDKAEVLFPEENCRYIKFLLWGARHWAAALGGNFDVVHFNAGIWDNHRYIMEDGADISLTKGCGEPFTTLSEYVATSERLVREIKAIAPQAAFATTIPGTVQFDDWNKRIKLFNDCVVPLYQYSGFEIDDLYSVINSDLEGNICEDKVHLSEKGIKECAEAVASFLERYL